MSFSKYAKCEILEVKGSPDKIEGASLGKLSSYADYRTGDGYLYTRVRAISSRVNKNHDGWPSDELAKSYMTFVGKPIFVDHHNSDPSKARGVIVDASLHQEDDMDKASALDPYYSTAPANHKPPTHIELLLEVDARSFPHLAKAIIDGDIDGVSMGCNVERSQCNIRQKVASSPEEYCLHVRNKGAIFDYYDPETGHKTARQSYEDCYDIGFFEISYVFDPADETALVKEVTASVHKEAAMDPFGDWLKMHHQRGELENLPVTQDDTPDNINIEQLMAAIEEFMRSEHRHSMMGADPMAPATPAVSAPPMVQTCPSCGSTMENGECPACGGMGGAGMDMMARRHLAEAPLPQSMMTTAPEHVDTLRQEQACPVCGSTMENGNCDVCNYEAPPEGFDNPDLTKAQEINEQMEEQAAMMEPQMAPADPAAMGAGGPPPPGAGATPPPAPGMVTTKLAPSGTVITAGKVNDNERPILPVKRTPSDHPQNVQVVKDQTRLIQSNKKESMDNITGTERIAQEMVARGLATDVAQAAHILQASGLDALVNKIAALQTQAADAVTEKADHANSNLDQVGGEYGNPEADTKHENVEKQVDIQRIPTQTWTDGKGDSLGQENPVGADNANELGGPIGSPVSANKQAAGFPDHEPSKVNLQAPLKEEVGDPTKTWGSDDFHITDPTTQGENANQVGGPIGQPMASKASVKAHLLKAMKLAETEVQMGLVSDEQKFERAGLLEEQSPEQLDARIDALSMVKKAGLSKTASVKRIGNRMPRLAGNSVTAATQPAVAENNIEDSGLFL